MKLDRKKCVVLAIDDRLPSRVTASILRNQGLDLFAVHLKFDLAAIGEDPSLYPSALQTTDVSKIEKFCESLAIPLKCIDVTEETLGKVYLPFWIATLTGKRFAASAAWAKDILFPNLEAVAKMRGADTLATGHFARITPDLCRYTLAEYDESRVLARVAPSTLEKLILPVGDVPLEMLLRLAREIGDIPKDATAFSLEREVKRFIEERARRGKWEWTDSQLADPRLQKRAAGDFFKPGPIEGSDEFVVAEHRGLPFFQIGSPLPENPTFYVREIHPKSRVVTAASEEKLAVHHIFLHDILWTGEKSKDRYRAQQVSVEKESAGARRPEFAPRIVPGTLLEFPGGLGELRLDHPLYAIAPGETLVFLEESRVLGSGIVAEMAIENTSRTS